MKTWNSLSYINLKNLYELVDISYPNIGELFEDSPFTRVLSTSYAYQHEDDNARRIIHPSSKKYEGTVFIAKVTKQLFLIPLIFIEECLNEKIDISNISDRNFQEELKDILFLKLKSISLKWIDNIIEKSEMFDENVIISIYVVTEENSVFIFDLVNKQANSIIKDFIDFTGAFFLDKNTENSFLDILIGRKNFRPFIYFQEYIDLEKKLEL